MIAMLQHLIDLIDLNLCAPFEALLIIVTLGGILAKARRHNVNMGWADIDAKSDNPRDSEVPHG